MLTRLLVGGGAWLLPCATGQTVDASFNLPANAAVNAVVIQRNGRVVLGGRFTAIDGIPRASIARLHADGSLDVDFSPGATASVECLFLQEDGKLLLGGFFTAVGGQTRNRVARLNPDGTLDPALSLVVNNGVFAIAADRAGRVVFGGSFTTVNGQPRFGIARLNPDGTLDPSFNPGASTPNLVNPAVSVGGVSCLLLQPDGRILLGGPFTTVAGQPQSFLARLHEDGSLDAAFTPVLNAPALCLALQVDDSVVAGGLFTRIDGQVRNFIARLSADGTLDPRFNPAAGAFVRSVIVRPGGTILISGDFRTVGGTPHGRIAQIDAGGSVDPAFTASLTGSIGSGTGSVVALAPAPDGTVVMGGNFSEANGEAYRGLCRITPPRGVETSRLGNLSVRSFAGSGDSTLIVGFGLSGAGTKPLLIRGIGPTLAAFGVESVIADPTLRLDLLNGSPVAENDNWVSAAALSAATLSVGAFALSPGSKDAALLPTLNANTYTAQIGGGAGVALVEIYDTAATSGPALANVSARTQAGGGSGTLIAGFVVTGASSKTLLLRAIGPSLGQFGVAGALADVRLELRLLSGRLVAENDDWGGGPAFTAAFAQAGAFGLPLASRDAALLVTVAPGAYTVQVSGVGATGIALVEVYAMP